MNILNLSNKTLAKSSINSLAQGLIKGGFSKTETRELFFLKQRVRELFYIFRASASTYIYGFVPNGQLGIRYNHLNVSAKFEFS